jgi:hypothetical protein
MANAVALFKEIGVGVLVQVHLGVDVDRDFQGGGVRNQCR